MRYLSRFIAAALFGSYSTLFGATTPVAPSFSVGMNLETSAVVTLSQPAPEGGCDITLHSSDAGRLLFAKQQDQAGSESLLLHVRAGFRASPEFWAQSSGGVGTVTYTAKLADQEGTGTATVTPSSMIITGPMKAPKFLTTTRSTPTSIHLTAVRLDSELKVAEEQFVAGGHSARVDIRNSQAGIGTITPAQLEIKGGTNTGQTLFQPSAEGNAALSFSIPPGFTAAPSEFASVTAVITLPGIKLSEELVIGQNLELRGVLALGVAAPVGGLKVTLTSDDPAKLLLATLGSAVGSKSITVKIPAGASWGPYYLQALGNSGTVKYSATAPGTRNASTTATLAPSGVILTPNFQGPPDEAQVLSKDPGDGTHRFSTALSKTRTMNLVAWTVQLDPVTHRSADITVQPLRGGLSLQISLVNSHPEVGRIPQVVTIAGGSEHSVAPFTLRAVGTTEISVLTPKDFTVSANSTKVVAIVTK